MSLPQVYATGHFFVIIITFKWGIREIVDRGIGSLNFQLRWKGRECGLFEIELRSQSRNWIGSTSP